MAAARRARRTRRALESVAESQRDGGARATAQAERPIEVHAHVAGHTINVDARRGGGRLQFHEDGQGNITGAELTE
jgi:hypothetical protein